jgi:hypothetical protein
MAAQLAASQEGFSSVSKVNECYFISVRNLENGELRWHGNIEVTKVTEMWSTGQRKEEG